MGLNNKLFPYSVIHSFLRYNAASAIVVCELTTDIGSELINRKIN